LNDISLHAFLTEVAAPTPAWSAGGVTAITAAAAAGLVAMAARLSPNLDGGEDLAVQADGLAARAIELADADAEAYRIVLAAQRMPRSDPARAARISETLAAAAQPPLELVAVAERVVRLAASPAVHGKRAIRGDAISAASLAAGAARSAAVLVRVNLSAADRADDPREQEAQRLAAAAERTAGELLGRHGPR
jgi:formiminotetrahydrofolate cyclodeaminase